MNQINDYNSTNTLSHTTWNCKYHIVFAPKYRRKVFYGEKRAEIGKILRELCEWKGVRINVNIKMYKFDCLRMYNFNFVQSHHNNL